MILLMSGSESWNTWKFGGSNFSITLSSTPFDPFFSVTSWQFHYRKLTVYELFFFSYRLYLGAHGNETFLRQVEEPLIDTFEFGTLPRAPVWIASIPWDRYFEQIWQILATVLFFDTLPFFSFLSVTLFYFKIFIFKCNIWAKLSTCR